MKPMVCTLALGLSLIVPVVSLSAADWPSWRGPNQNQVSPDRGFPLEWAWSKDGPAKNIRWRIPLPEAGNSTPIVWGDRVFVTQAVDDGRRRTVIAFDRATGRQLWQSGVTRDVADSRHETNPHCAASPVTDGERVVASFASAGVVAYDFAGKELWKADLGPQTHGWGQGSSPVIQGDRVFVYHGPGKDSALYSLDRRTGAVQWKVALPEESPAERFDGFAGKSDGAKGSFSTPLVVPSGGREEIILPVANQLRAFAPADGRSLWTCQGMNPLVYTSASYGEGRIVAMGGFFGSVIILPPGGSGDVTSRRTFYEQRAKKHRIGSPIIHQGHVYLAATEGFLQCLKLDTGEMLWEERLKASGSDPATWGSLVLAGDRFYLVNHSGDTLVVRAAPKFEVLASNPVGELSNSTLALSNGEIFLRTHSALYCVKEGARTAAR
jgi:outer membrane protein assembly factor BamB